MYGCVWLCCALHVLCGYLRTNSSASNLLQSEAREIRQCSDCYSVLGNILGFCRSSDHRPEMLFAVDAPCKACIGSEVLGI